MVDNTKEIYIGALPDPVSLEGTQKIIDQMNNSVCIIYNENIKGMDFLLKFHMNQNYYLY